MQIVGLIVFIITTTLVTQLRAKAASPVIWSYDHVDTKSRLSQHPIVGGFARALQVQCTNDRQCKDVTCELTEILVCESGECICKERPGIRDFAECQVPEECTELVCGESFETPECTGDGKCECKSVLLYYIIGIAIVAILNGTLAKMTTKQLIKLDMELPPGMQYMSPRIEAIIWTLVLFTGIFGAIVTYFPLRSLITSRLEKLETVSIHDPESLDEDPSPPHSPSSTKQSSIPVAVEVEQLAQFEKSRPPDHPQHSLNDNEDII